MQKWSMRLIRFIYSILNVYDGFVWGKVEMEMEKSVVHPKMKVLSSFIHPHDVKPRITFSSLEHKYRYCEES